MILDPGISPRAGPRDRVTLSRVRYDYTREALDALAGHGLLPGDATDPALVRDAVSDLYRYEIRLLKGRFLDGLVGKPDYAPEVIALRRRYWLLSVPVQHWAQSR